MHEARQVCVLKEERKLLLLPLLWWGRRGRGQRDDVSEFSLELLCSGREYVVQGDRVGGKRWKATEGGC